MPRGHPIPIPVPRFGAKTDVTQPELPDGYLARSSNVVARFGRLVFRPGFVKAVATGPGARIQGGISFKRTDLVRRVVAATATKWSSLAGSTWTDITPVTQLTGDADNAQRFEVFPQSGVNWLIGTNNADTPQKWNGSTATFAAVGGSPCDKAVDVTAQSNRVIFFNVVLSGTRYHSRLVISAFNDMDTYDLTNLVADLTDTDGEGVAVRHLNQGQFAAYKTDSVWLGTAQAGIFPFQLALVEKKPGPLTPAALLVYGNAHYWIGQDFRLYKFDGLAVTALSDNLDADILAALRPGGKARVFGVYRSDDRSLWWYFPSLNSTDPDLAVSYHVETGDMNLHVLPFQVTAAWAGEDLGTITWASLATFTWATLPATYPTWGSMGGTLKPTVFIGSQAGQVYRSYFDTDDDGTPITASWDSPLRAYEGIQKQHLADAVESSFEQVAGGPLVLIDIGVSDALASDTPTYTNFGSHDTTLTTRQLLAPLGTIAQGRFLNIRHRVTSSLPLKYKGSELYVWSEDLP